MSERRIALEGALNIRDIGGYETSDGRSVRWSRLLRGDNTDALTDNDVRVLVDYGLASVVDLRHPREAEKWPSVFVGREDIRYVNVSMRTSGLWDTFDRGPSLASWYIFCLERAGQKVRKVLEALSLGTGHGCTLVHCAAGKDRTGLVIALLLATLGVSAETIAEDYAMSGQYLEPLFERWRLDAIERGADMSLFEWEMSADPEVMSETLSHLDNRYGGVEGYLQSLNLPQTFAGDLRSTLLR